MRSKEEEKSQHFRIQVGVHQVQDIDRLDQCACGLNEE